MERVITTPAPTPTVIPRPDIEPNRVRKPDEYCPAQKRRLASPDVAP